MESNNRLLEVIKLLQCPQCSKGEIEEVTTDASLSLQCKVCGAQYPISHQRPVLLRTDNDVFTLDDYTGELKTSSDNEGGINKFIPTPSVNLASTRILQKLGRILSKHSSSRVLVIGGGGQKQWLDEALGLSANSNIQILYSDIDVAATVDLFCDGHDLPFKDDVFDAIITTAVLEHVLYPEKVASEIYRVLKVDGVLYSELPFMQQVHEGAYDFTRYTLSGHRRLFNGFSEIESGMVAGPGTVLAWSIENFILSFISKSLLRKMAKVFARLFFSWFKYFDYYLVNKPQAMDGASCTFFLGKKAEEKTLDSDIISNYVGAKHLSHTEK